MPKNRSFLTLLLMLSIIVFIFTACEPVYEGRPTGIPTHPPTKTVTPTITSIPTEAPTVTPTLTITPTYTPTAIPSPTATMTPTAVPARISGLIDLKVGDDTKVEWNYTYLTQNNKRENGSQYNLSALMAFQMLDRGIHTETIKLLDNEITVYYLRVRHAFKAEHLEVKLILTGTFGDNVAIDAMPADGSNFIFYRTQNSDVPFQPAKIATDWDLPVEQRNEHFQGLTLRQFQVILDELPENFILFAEHPIIIEPERWNQVRLDMERISASGARLNPFFAFNELNQLIGQTSLATILQQNLVSDVDIPGDVRQKLVFSAEYILVITP